MLADVDRAQAREHGLPRRLRRLRRVAQRVHRRGCGRASRPRWPAITTSPRAAGIRLGLLQPRRRRRAARWTDEHADARSTLEYLREPAVRAAVARRAAGARLAGRARGVALRALARRRRVRDGGVRRGASCFIGHSHYPGTFELDGRARALHARPASSHGAAGSRYLVNVPQRRASRATAIRARATCCSTTRRDASSTCGSSTTSPARWRASATRACRRSWPSGCSGANDRGRRPHGARLDARSLGVVLEGPPPDIDDTYSTGGRLVREVLADGPVEGRWVMEIGAGSGRDLLELARRGARGIVLDYSPASLALVQRAGRRAGRRRCCSCRRTRTRMPFRDGAIDVVVPPGTARALPRPHAAAARERAHHARAAGA